MSGRLNKEEVALFRKLVMLICMVDTYVLDSTIDSCFICQSTERRVDDIMSAQKFHPNTALDCWSRLCGYRLQEVGGSYGWVKCAICSRPQPKLT